MSVPSEFFNHDEMNRFLANGCISIDRESAGEEFDSMDGNRMSAFDSGKVPNKPREEGALVVGGAEIKGNAIRND